MRSLKIFAVLLALNAGAWITPQEASAQRSSASFRLFYDELSPYGTWVDYQNYGYVWMPNTDPDFSPYVTSGRWIFTDDGWTWVSDYPWGWATFHYGRWDYDNVYGWFWVPDDVWGPAWVSWRRSPGYFGWAPLRPGISISIAFGRDYHERNERWTFVRDRDFTRPDMDRRYVDRGNNNSIMKGSTVIVNTQRDDKRNATYITGPARNDVQQITHAAVTPVAIREADKPGHRLSNGELQIYRPQIQRGNGQDPAPARVARLSDLKPASERSAGNRQQQPPTVTQPAQGQPPQAHTVPSLPRNGRQQQQMRMEAPPPQSQPAQQRTVILPAGRGRQQQSRAVSPGQPVQPKAVTPSDGKGNPQQAPTVIPPNRGQSPRPLTIDPSRGRGLEKQTQNVPLPKKVDQTQPTKNKEEKSKQDEKPKQRE